MEFFEESSGFLEDSRRWRGLLDLQYLTDKQKLERFFCHLVHNGSSARRSTEAVRKRTIAEDIANMSQRLSVKLNCSSEILPAFKRIASVVIT